MSKLEDAEALLKSLERHEHAVANANIALRNAEYSGDPEKIAAAKAVYDAAVADQKASGASSRDIDRAAQAIHNERGETHTETNILPPDGGVATVIAENVE